LLSLKALHEAWTARELEGTSSHFGWIESLYVRSSPLFLDSTRIELGKLSLLIGDNGSGKTALCEWLAAAADARYLDRWKPRGPEHRALDVEVNYVDPEPHSTRFSFLNDRHPEYEADGKPTGVPTAPLKVIFPKRVDVEAFQKAFNDLELMSDVLRMHPFEVMSLCKRVSANPFGGVTQLRFETRNDRVSLLVDIESEYRPGVPFGALSHSESERVVLALASAAANDLASRYPTLLVLDGVARFDNNWLRRHGESLSAATNKFQTIACLPPRSLNLDELRWAGWKLFHLEGEPPRGRVRSAVRD